MGNFLVYVLLLTLSIVGGSSAQGNSACAQWCAANFANLGAQCTSLAAHGSGPCYVCGPQKKSPTEQLCSGLCSETSSDIQNCGKCANVCPAGAICKSGTCQCSISGLPLCSGACPDFTSDLNNCGKCGNVCPPGSKCSSSACVCTNSGLSLCNGVCPDFTSDLNNCGKCGNVCPPGSKCSSSACVCTNSGLSPCKGACPDLNSDINNCGICGTVCSSDSGCSSGTCTYGACGATLPVDLGIPGFTAIFKTYCGTTTTDLAGSFVGSSTQQSFSGCYNACLNTACDVVNYNIATGECDYFDGAVGGLQANPGFDTGQIIITST